MDQKVLNARTRTETGKGAAKRIRKEGRLPSIMYDGTGKATLIDIDAKEFAKLSHLITESTLIDINLDGKKNVIAFVKDMQYNIISNTIGHVDFYEVDAAKALRTHIRIKLVGSPEGVRMGGVLETGTMELDVECLPKHLPERVSVDVGQLQLNHSIHVRDIKLPEGVKIHTDGDLTVATLKYSKSDVPAAAAAETPAAAPAAPAAKK